MLYYVILIDKKDFKNIIGIYTTKKDALNCKNFYIKETLKSKLQLNKIYIQKKGGAKIEKLSYY